MIACRNFFGQNLSHEVLLKQGRSYVMCMLAATDCAHLAKPVKNIYNLGRISCMSGSPPGRPITLRSKEGRGLAASFMHSA